LGDWGLGYVAVNDAGHVTIHPERDPKRAIDLHELVCGLGRRGIRPPMLLRFGQILADRIQTIRGAFDGAITRRGYDGRYVCLYPIKVNQQRHVCEQIRDIGSPMGFGFEAGSKPELLAVLGLTCGQDRMPIVCNGFKDEAYVRTALLGDRLGRRIILVVERFEELGLILDIAGALGVEPTLGIRVRLDATGAGRWETSTGPGSKFGLTMGQSLEALEVLRARGMADRLNLLHVHPGSQVHEISRLSDAINELARVYTELRRLGAGLTMIDVGGGLAVDYDGSATAWESSRNYSIHEYASEMVGRIGSACDQAGIAHPTILTESGRAIVAYSSVMIVETMGRSGAGPGASLDRIRASIETERRRGQAPGSVLELLATLDALDRLDPIEAMHEAMRAREQTISMFALGVLSLPMRAAGEALFDRIGRRLLERVGGEGASGGETPEAFAALARLLGQTYHCNFSIFQSLPDAWAIGQVFPVCPIHRLDKRPARRGTLADLTCDSDGRLDRFVGSAGRKRTLELHEPDGAYRLGVFLLGAYQEILGDMHNLFGDVPAVHVSLCPDGRWHIDEVIEGDRVRDVLAAVQYEPERLRRAIRADAERAIRDGWISVEQAGELLECYARGLDGSTYLE